MSTQLVPRFEFGHFHKFLVSLGLILCLAALAVPWFVLRESGVLLVSNGELAGLTETGRDTIERKQVSLAILVTLWPYVSVILLVVGFGLIAFGLIHWRQRQAVSDRMEDLNRAKLEDEVRQLTPAEVSDKLERESQEQQTELARAGGELPPLQQSLSGEVRHEEFRARLLEAEAVIATKVGEALLGTHIVKSNLAVRSKSGHAELDLVAESKSKDLADIVVELKYSRIPSLGMLGEWVLRAARNRQFYSEATNRKAFAVLWLIYEKPEPSPPRRDQLTNRIRQYVQLVSPPVRVLRHTREELDALSPESLRQHLTAPIDEE